MTAVKEAVDNSIDACEEAGILPEISVDLEQTGDNRFRVTITDNGPGIVKAQIPKIFAKLLYGSKFHRLRMSRGQQGIGISAAGMYGQLTTGSATIIRSRIKGGKAAHQISVQIDTRQNKPTILSDVSIDWRPTFPGLDQKAKPRANRRCYKHGTSVSHRNGGRLRARQVVGGRIPQAMRDREPAPDAPLFGQTEEAGKRRNRRARPRRNRSIKSFLRGVKTLPPPSIEIMPHPHGVELGMLMQMLKDTESRTVRSALATDFSRVSAPNRAGHLRKAEVDPKAKPDKSGPQQIEAIYRTIQETKLMRPPTDCLAPIGEERNCDRFKKGSGGGLLHVDHPRARPCTGATRFRSRSASPTPNPKARRT
jgi:DNA topoisomerase-6 subunit B